LSNHILYTCKPCGCVLSITRVDDDAARARVVKIEQAAKSRSYKLEWLTAEEHKARPWECPEHQAQRVRVAREKVAHQEQPALKG
jgi:hypothetical protein